ncbi:HlyD family secretion protein [Bacteroides bouchesdurhonensis]|uniref:HlyD family secretion protein n=1 Tax=Bacteroides bouchesdurhonensis TaxID=1841855 RepID=UPI0011DCA28D|nr:HlyD family efflux transporter periplasmic adaptor subunit [Bacteroides bouchesdurhonensis]
MKNEKKYKDIELRSNEVQEVMNHIPSSILRYGITVLFIIVCLLIIGSAFFNYPDTVETEFTLTTQSPPAYITAGSGGRIESLYVRNKQTVRKGEILGVIENIARTEELYYLREKTKQWKASGSQTEQIRSIFFSRIPELGSVQAAYSACLLAWNNYLQNMQKSRIHETELINTVASLITSISEWEKNYLLTAPTDGTVAFMQLWEEKQQVEKGETMFVIIPTDALKPIGKALLPMDGIGKVKIGQRAIIRLPAFPEQEFGFIEGKVVSISPVPDSEGRYILEISMPRGLITNYGKELPLIKTISGTASIVTKEKTLLSKLLNFKNTE